MVPGLPAKLTALLDNFAGETYLNQMKARCLFHRLQLASIRHTIARAFAARFSPQTWTQWCAGQIRPVSKFVIYDVTRSEISSKA
jgi:hypothetical protein